MFLKCFVALQPNFFFKKMSHNIIKNIHEHKCLFKMYVTIHEHIKHITFPNISMNVFEYVTGQKIKILILSYNAIKLSYKYNFTIRVTQDIVY